MAAKPCSTSSSATASVIYGTRVCRPYSPQQRDVCPQRRVEVAQQLRVTSIPSAHPVCRAVHALLRLLAPTRYAHTARLLAVQRHEVRRRVGRLAAALRPYHHELPSAHGASQALRRHLRLELVRHHHGVSSRRGVRTLHLERNYP